MTDFCCMIIGSRSFNDYEFMKSKADSLLQNRTNVEIVSGGAKGADALAKRYALEKGFKYTEFPADWNRYGKSAGYIRNEEMHRYLSEHNQRGCIAFWDGESRRTAHSFNICHKESPTSKRSVGRGGIVRSKNYR